MIRVVSLFDGMSCGRVALQRAGIPVRTYTASEIDKYAIHIAQKNYPSTIQLGDVRHVRQMAQFGLFGHIDLLIGGSPCQGFSFAGKQLAFDDPRSVLFFEFVWTLQALRQINPDIKFMLENVKMKKEHLDVITRILGVEPVCINSALVSAQNRVRYYWANWTVSQPADRGIYLRDILEYGPVAENHTLSIAATERLRRTKYSKPQIMPEKTGTLNTKNNSGQFSFDSGTTLIPVGGAIRGRYVEGDSGETEQGLEIRDDDKANCLTTKTKDSVVAYPPKGGTFRRFGGNLEIRKDEKSNALLSDGHQSRFLSDDMFYRKLTPVECERLQTVPDNYTAGVSDTQRYRMLGNGWTVDVIAHIFREMPR